MYISKIDDMFDTKALKIKRSKDLFIIIRTKNSSKVTAVLVRIFINKSLDMHWQQ